MPRRCGDQEKASFQRDPTDARVNEGGEGTQGETVFFLYVCEHEIAFESECGDEIEAARHRRRMCRVDLE